jgi:hypothetical protein
VLGAVVTTGRAPDLVAAALIAVLLVPLRDRLQRGVDRIVYGAWHDPLAAVRRLGVAMTDESPDSLSAVVGSIAAALRSPYVAVRDMDRAELAASGHPPFSGTERIRPLTVGGRQVADLVVCPAPGETALAHEHR